MATNSKIFVTPRAFSALQRVDIEELSKLSDQEIRPLLPCVVRMALCSPLDQSSEWIQTRKTILRILSGIELVNSIVRLLSIDFHALESDLKKEQQLRMKLGCHAGESVLVSSLESGLSLEFERSEGVRRLRLLLSELLAIMAQVKEVRNDIGIRASELFDNDVYFDEVSDVLCIALAELPGLFPVCEVAETLLHIKNGPGFLCRLVANSPDSFREVCHALITNGEKHDEESISGKIRMQALRMLCQMNMSQALALRAKAVELCRMPGLAVLLTLDHCRQEHGDNADFDSVVGDLVAFVSGLLLGSDDKVRAWFAQYVRNGHKKNEMGGSWTLHPLREELLQRLQNLVLFSIDQHNLPDFRVVQASSLLRLYCSLRGIAGLKFHEDETNLLLQLLTSHPPPSPAGIRFVSLGLCMLLACPTLLSSQDHEKRAVEWIHWLLKEESYFGRVSGVNASFGELLLLIAIHFHSNQMNAVSDLVCSTLGMKVPIRPNNLARMKTIFTQEIFTDQIVTAHAVKVPVTPNLSGHTAGFLPVHCIHQLLKSRAFTKHKVPIKDWIYKQLCSTTPPLHPVLPPLIEAYVNSVIVPSSKGNQDTTNEPITEEEILAVFRRSVFVPEEISKSGPSKISESCPSGRTSPVAMDVDGNEGPSSVTSQLLLLYYLLLYEDTRLSNMKAIIMSNRKVKRYSAQFMSQLPIFHLIQQAQREQHKYAGIFSPLLRLVATHYPQLCLPEDWLAGESSKQLEQLSCPESNINMTSLTKHGLKNAFAHVHTCPFQLLALLDQLLGLPVQQMWPFASIFCSQFPLLLHSTVVRHIQEKAKEFWLKLNSVFPRRLWMMTINALRPAQSTVFGTKQLSWDDVVLDPLHILRCDKRVFRVAPFLEIVLQMLRAFLAASRTHLAHHVLEHPLLEKGGQLESEKDREELRIALVAAQESAAVQILLESCLPTKEDEEVSGLLTRLREVQSIVFSNLHQVFIADPNLAKLVHFQGYPSELLPLAVSSIPSMHICLDFIPELISQPHMEKQVFAIELASHLCLQYSIPKYLSIAKLCVNVANTLIGVLPSEQRPIFFLPTLPALVRMCRAFPPLCEDVAFLLFQVGRVCLSYTCTLSTAVPVQTEFPSKLVLSGGCLQTAKDAFQKLSSDDVLSAAVQKAFSDLCDIFVLHKLAY